MPATLVKGASVSSSSDHDAGITTSAHWEVRLGFKLVLRDRLGPLRLCVFSGPRVTRLPRQTKDGVGSLVVPHEVVLVTERARAAGLAADVVALAEVHAVDMDPQAVDPRECWKK